MLLDLQRPEEAETTKIAETILATLPCPVGISEWYAKDMDCPVFLSPVPLIKTPESYLLSWQGREIWMELALTRGNYQITEQGCRLLPFSPREQAIIHKDCSLHCQYSMEVCEDTVTFSLERSPEALQALCQAAESLGVTCFVGLYQELG